MKRLDFDTPSGRGFLDATLLKLGESLPGDVLVIHYGGEATWGDAVKLQEQLMEAGRGLPLRHEVPLVLAAAGTTPTLLTPAGLLAAEREACAKIAEEECDGHDLCGCSWIAKTIRARGGE